jgi:hypothetical protein
MGYRFCIKKRVWEDEAPIAFIDLLGTRKLSKNTATEKHAQKILYGLLNRFDIKFAEHFGRMEQNFDVSIFGDSIVICEWKRTPEIVELLVNFLLSYQADLFLNLGLPSRAVVIKDCFWSFKLTGASSESILGSPYTSVSLSGGRSIEVHDYLRGLPMGVYVAKQIEKDLTTEQKERVIPIRNRDLIFIKQKPNILNFLLGKYEKTYLLLSRNSNANNKAIRNSLKACDSDKDALDKLSPWISLHHGTQKEIIPK